MHCCTVHRSRELTQPACVWMRVQQYQPRATLAHATVRGVEEVQFVLTHFARHQPARLRPQLAVAHARGRRGRELRALPLPRTGALSLTHAHRIAPQPHPTRPSPAKTTPSVWQTQKAPLLAALQAAGHVAAAVHVDAKAVRTTASMAQVVAIARQLS
jgi:hypothetical protein